MSDRLIGVVIVYNPDKKLISNIGSYLNDLDQLIVIDNSDSNHDFTTLGFQSNKIRLIQKPENIGIASALNIAAKIALQQGYNWMLTMDQDSAFLPGTFAVYAAIPQTIHHSEKIAIIGPEIYAEDEISPSPPSQVQLEDADLIITSGSIISLAIWKEIGGFEDKLFIDEVDHDYCLKALSNKYVIKAAKGIYLAHNLGKSLFISKKGVVQRKVLHPPKRLYYIVRNGIYLMNKYSDDFPKICKSRRKILYITVKNNLLYGSDRFLQLKFIILGVWHYLIGKYGKQT